MSDGPKITLEPTQDQIEHFDKIQRQSKFDPNRIIGGPDPTPAAAPPPDFETALKAIDAKHPRPWRVEEDWTCEVLDAKGALIIKIPYPVQLWLAQLIVEATNAEREAELEDERNEATKAFENAWTLVRELREKVAESERRREAAEKMLAEADAVIASNCGGYAFPHIRGTALAPCWGWKDQAVARHAARSKEG